MPGPALSLTSSPRRRFARLRRPARSPFWAAVHSHLWLVVIIVVLVGAAGTAYWGLRVHQRIGEATLERGIGGREHASTIRCVEQQSNGAVWACGLVYRAESVCLIANVNPVGDWNTKPGADLCDHRSSLTALLPARHYRRRGRRGSEVAAQRRRVEMRQDPGTEGAVGVPRPRRGEQLVLGDPNRALGPVVIPDSSTACAHIPALRKSLGKRQ